MSDPAPPAADTLAISSNDLQFWQDAPYMEFALPTYAPYIISPLKTKAFVNGSDIDVYAANTFVTRTTPSAGSPFAGRNLFDFAANANAVIAVPTLALGQSYTFIVPFTCSALNNGGFIGHISTTGDYIGFQANAVGQLLLRHGAISTGRFAATGGAAYAINQINVVIATFDLATMTARIYGMSGAAMKLAPLVTTVLTYAPKNEVGFNVGNLFGASGAFQTDDIVAFNSAIDVQNPTLFSRLQSNLATKYGLTTVA